MTTPGHGILGATGAVAITVGIFGLSSMTIVVAVLLGALFSYRSQLPDLIGIVGGSPKDWTVYYSAHVGLIASRYKSDPFYQLHLFIDRYVHNPVTYGWKPVGYWIEVAVDLITLTCLWLLLSVWPVVWIVAAHIVFLGAWKLAVPVLNRYTGLGK